MSKIKFIKDYDGVNLAIKEFKKPLIATVINKNTLSFLFSDGTKKSLTLKSNQVKALSKSGKLYQYKENPMTITSIKKIQIIS